VYVKFRGVDINFSLANTRARMYCARLHSLQRKYLKLNHIVDQGFSTGVPRDVARGSARDRD
jgi:hypothetical protein